MMEELKPCPFCGSKAEFLKHSDADGYFRRIEEMFDVRCTNSKCYLADGAEFWLTQERAAELWNTRKNSDNAN